MESYEARPWQCFLDRAFACSFLCGFIDIAAEIGSLINNTSLISQQLNVLFDLQLRELSCTRLA